jgi:hypothetical protein
MVSTKKAILAIGSIAALVLVCSYWINKYRQTYSFAPERREQTVLALQHADCAAFYYLQNRNEVISKDQKKMRDTNGVAMFELHAKLGINFSPDKEKFNSSVNASLKQLVNDVVEAEKNNVVDKFIAEKQNSCAEILLNTNNFINNVHVHRSKNAPLNESR